ncbi:oligosaccharide flippase family protein [Eubacterium sp.]
MEAINRVDKQKAYNQKNRALIMGTIIYAIGNLGTKFLSFLIVPLYTHYIVPSELGDYDLMTTTINLIAPFITFQITDAAYRWMVGDEEYIEPCISQIYRVLILNSILVAAGIYLINYFVPIYYCPYFIAILILGRWQESLQKILRGLKRQKLFATTGIIYTAVFVFLNLYKITVQHKGIIALLESSIIAPSVAIMFMLIAEKRLRKFNLFDNNSKLLKQMFKYSIPLIPTTLNWWVINASDRYIIKYFLGSYANGIYAVAYKFPTILSTIFQMFTTSWMDMVLSEKTQEDIAEYYTGVFKYFYKIAFGLAICIIPITKIVCFLILDESYLESVDYIPFLYLGTVFQSFSSFFSIGYLRSKSTIGAATTSVYGAIVNFVVNIVFINYIGLHAAAISTFLGFFVMWFIRVVQTRKSLPIGINWGDFLFRLAISIAICFITIKSSLMINSLLFIVSTIYVLIDNKNVIGSVMKKILAKITKCK